MSVFVGIAAGGCMVLAVMAFIKLLSAIGKSRRLNHKQTVVLIVVLALAGFILLAIMVNWFESSSLVWFTVGVIVGAALWWEFMVKDLELPASKSEVFDRSTDKA